MRVNITCKRCGQRFQPKWSKIGTVLGGSAMIMLMGVLLATPTGWLAVIPAALAGSRNAQKIFQYKVKLATASHKEGSYFCCRRCPRDVSLGEIFFDTPPALPPGQDGTNVVAGGS